MRDENSFQVEVKSQTGWSWLPGNCFVQTYELNEENEHEHTDGDGGTGMSIYRNTVVLQGPLVAKSLIFSDQCDNNV